MNMRFIRGDATSPIGDGVKMIVHICNDAGKWGSGFVLSLSRRWPHPKKEYMAHIRKGGKIGQVSFAQVEPQIWVTNMIAQHGTKGESRHPPIRYGELRVCLIRAAQKARKLKASIHMPRIGCDRAGGKWQEVDQIIKETLSDFDVFVYDLPR